MDSVPKLWQVIYVPGETKPEQSTVDTCVAKIQPSVASTIIRRLNSCMPLIGLDHVKRVRRRSAEGEIELSIILCLAPDDGDRSSFISALPSEVLQLVEEYCLQPFITTVSARAASTREEWEEQCKIWPTSYHPNAANINAASICFGSNELRRICELMGLAISQAKLGASKSQPANGAIIVDPIHDHIISVGHDETAGWIGKMCDSKNCNEHQERCHPLRHAIMVAIERAVTNMNGEVPKEEDALTECSTKRVRMNDSSEIMVKSFFSQQYLCTGFDAYVTREPCSMCAMALLHQRVQRVFYGISNPNFGALGGQQRIHGKLGLNHHYSVFQVALTEEDLW